MKFLNVDTVVDLLDLVARHPDRFGQPRRNVARYGGLAVDQPAARFAQQPILAIRAGLVGDVPPCSPWITERTPASFAYMAAGYPNWATKYFIDALLTRRAVAAGNPLPLS